MTKDSAPLSNSEILNKLDTALHPERSGLLIKRAIAEGASHEHIVKESIMQLIEQVCNESRKDELKQLWNYTQSDIVPEGAKPNDMSDRLHERIKELENATKS